jgi:hypothetical protein
MHYISIHVREIQTDGGRKYIVSHVRQCHGVNGVEKIDHILTSSKKLALHRSQTPTRKEGQNLS